MLSLGEQQRLGIARAILHAPDYLFLDEATASLDEPAEAALYRLLEQRLAGTTIVSIGHRSTLAAFHRRRLSFKREGDRYWLREDGVIAGGRARPHWRSAKVHNAKRRRFPSGTAARCSRRGRVGLATQPT